MRNILYSAALVIAVAAFAGPASAQQPGGCLDADRETVCDGQTVTGPAVPVGTTISASAYGGPASGITCLVAPSGQSFPLSGSGGMVHGNFQFKVASKGTWNVSCTINGTSYLIGAVRFQAQ